MNVTAPVNPNLIKWAIVRSGLSMEILREKFKKIDSWIDGEKEPTFRQLEDFAKKTMTPLGFLFLNDPPLDYETIQIPDFRTLGDTKITRPSPNLIETIRTMQGRQQWIKDLSIEDGGTKVALVGSASASDNPRTLAQHIRQDLQLSPEWAETLGSWEDGIKVLRNAIEARGILVFSNSVVGLNNNRALDPEEFRGFVLCDSHAPLIFVNSADTKSAQIFTLAHELVHVWIGRDGLFNLIGMAPSSDVIERFCNNVAAELLVPEHTLREIWPTAKSSNNPFALIARRFKVSPIVAARRAQSLGMITKAQFLVFYERDRTEWQKRKDDLRKKSGGGDFYATQDLRLSRRFSNTIVRAVREGRMLNRDAWNLTDLKGETFNRFASHVLTRMRNDRE